MTNEWSDHPHYAALMMAQLREFESGARVSNEGDNGTVIVSNIVEINNQSSVICAVEYDNGDTLCVPANFLDKI